MSQPDQSIHNQLPPGGQEFPNGGRVPPNMNQGQPQPMRRPGPDERGYHQGGHGGGNIPVQGVTPGNQPPINGAPSNNPQALQQYQMRQNMSQRPGQPANQAQAYQMRQQQMARGPYTGQQYQIPVFERIKNLVVTKIPEAHHELLKKRREQL